MAVEDKVLHKYIDSVLDILKFDTGKTPMVPEDTLIEDSLTLKCPNRDCAIALDPNPDGCCAMKCRTCGCSFCWLCLRSTESSDECHRHVASCLENPCLGHLFVPADKMAIVHRRRKLEAIRHSLFIAVRGYTWMNDEKIKLLAWKKRHILAEAGIEPRDLFTSFVMLSPDPKGPWDDMGRPMATRDGEPIVDPVRIRNPRARSLDFLWLALTLFGVFNLVTRFRDIAYHSIDRILVFTMIIQHHHSPVPWFRDAIGWVVGFGVFTMCHHAPITMAYMADIMIIDGVWFVTKGLMGWSDADPTVIDKKSFVRAAMMRWATYCVVVNALWAQRRRVPRWVGMVVAASIGPFLVTIEGPHWLRCTWRDMLNA